MLDDLKYIHQRDSQDALGIAEKQWQQLEHEFDFRADSLRADGIENIVYAGMGGSALAAYLSTSWPGHKLPFEICRQYHVPQHVSPKTLFIAASYSGNTEETFAALAEAEERGAQIVLIAAGGQLQSIAEQKSYPILILPKAAQPRYGVLSNLKALVTILEEVGFVDKDSADQSIHQAAGFLRDTVQPWLPTVPAASNPAKKLAQELAGKSVVVYGGPVMAPAAYKWKININENAKNIAWWNQLPEFDHNELLGWSSHPVNKPYGIVEIRSNLEHERVQKRFEVGERLLSGRRPSPYVIHAQGQDLLQQLLWSVAFGDFVSIYLAFLNNVDPAPVDLVEKFKSDLQG